MPAARSTMPWLLLCGLLAAGTVRAQGTAVVSDGTLHTFTGTVHLAGGTMTFTETGSLRERASGPGGTGRVAGGVLTATRTLNAPDAVNVAGLGAVISSGANLGETVVTRGHTVQAGGGNEGVARYYDIAPANNTDLDATLVFTYHPAELNGLPEAELALYRSADGGATWEGAGGTLNTTLKTITLGGIDAFSRWTAAAASAPLPVELSSFTAVADGEAVVLRWTTASETNNAGFDVEYAAVETRRGASLPWQRLAFVAGSGTTTEARSYTYRAGGLEPGAYRFRLRQVDFDGGFAYSPEVEVAVEPAAAFVLSGPYPNPFVGRTTLRFAVREAGAVRVEVFDAAGRRVAVLFDGAAAAGAMRELTLDGAGLASGVYLVRLTGAAFADVRQVTLLR